MSRRVVVRSSDDNHILFSVFKAYYPHVAPGIQEPQNHLHLDAEVSAWVSGSGIYCCGDREYPFSAGDVLFHSANAPHYIKYVDPGDSPSLIVVRFDPRLVWSPSGDWSSPELMSLFSGKASGSRHIPADSPTAGSIVKLLYEIFDECHRQDHAYEIVVKSKIMTVLAYLVRCFYNEPEISSSPVINRRYLLQMESSTNYILSHLDAPLTLDMLAKEACMSRSYYSTMFKELNGISVWDYITKQRIDLAQYQLEHSELSITQISENCGFNSISNFNRAFRKLTGKTPREYRCSVNTGETDRREAENDKAIS